MHGPDGTNYPNKCRFLEIVPLERIVYLLGGGSDLDADERRGATFRATWVFESLDGERTKVTGRMVFPSKEVRDRVARDYGAVEGGRQTLERLSEQLAVLRCTPLVVTREFAAPLELVWRAWTEADHFARWFGPKGCTVHLARFEPRPGGIAHLRLSLPDGQEMWVRAAYRELVPQRKLVWVTSPSDAEGGITARPMWPRERLTVVSFAYQAGRTTVTVLWVPLDATAADLDAFESGRSGASAGWHGPFEKLAALCEEISR